MTRTQSNAPSLAAQKEDDRRQRRLRASSRKSMFIMEASFYPRAGHYFPISRETLGTEISFCNRWKKWEEREKSEKEFEFLLRFFGYWVKDVVSKFNFGQQLRYSEAPVQLGCLFGIAIARGDSLEEFREAAWNYLDTILYP